MITLKSHETTDKWDMKRIFKNAKKTISPGHAQGEVKVIKKEKKFPIRQMSAVLPTPCHLSLPRPSCVRVSGSICSVGRTTLPGC